MRVCVRFLVSFCAVFVVSVLCSGHAAAKEPTAQDRKAATDGFKSCHEQEGYGDATACWHIWFDKFEHVGTEAEVLFAQERLKRAGVAPKPHPAPAAPAPAAPAPAAPTPAPTPKATKPEPKGSEVKVEPVPAPVPEAAPEAAPEAPAAAAAGPAVLTVTGPNLCEQKPNPNATGSTKKRVIVFAPAGADSIESDAGIKRVGGAQQLRDVFFERFPLDRFYNLLTSLSGQAGWEAKPSLTKDEIKQYITTATAGADAALTAQLTAAIDCADFLVFPTITAHSVKPVPSAGSPIQLSLDGSMGIFKVTDTGFQLVTTLTESVPGLMDRGVDMAAIQAAKAMSSATSGVNGAMSQANKAADQAKNVANQAQNAANQAENAASSVGDAAGNLANGQVPGPLGTSASTAPGAAPGAGDALGGAGLPQLKNPMAGMHERMSEACTKAKTPDQSLICEVRVRAYQLSFHFREDAMSVEGWQLVSPLRFGVGNNASAPAISIGKEESLKVGDGFVATDPNGERLGHFKVVHVGPGGAAGEAQPSELKLRLGAATEGMQLHEYHVWGLELTAHGSVETLVANSAEHYVFVPFAGPLDATGRPVGEYVPYQLPTLMVGGGGSLGFDMSGLLSWSETRLRLRAEYLSGNGSGLAATAMPIDLSFEKGFYLGKGLNFFVGLGPTLSLITVKVSTEVPPGAAALPTYDLTAKRFGFELDPGLDILFSPRVALRISGIFGYNFGSSYSGVIPWAPDQLTDSFSTLGGNLGLNFIL